MDTWNYEIFHGEFSTPEDIDMNGGKSGNISFKDCSSPKLGLKTQIGHIDVSGCSMKELNSMTRSGTLKLQLADRITNYKMMIDTDVDAQISINDKTYQGGEFILNENAHNNIYFDSKNGSVVIIGSI